MDLYDTFLVIVMIQTLSFVEAHIEFCFSDGFHAPLGAKTITG